MSPVHPGRRPLFRRGKRLLVLLVDVALFLNAYAGAFLVRADLHPYPSALRHFEQTVLTLILAKAVVFVLAGTYRGLVMYATIPDLLTLVRTTTLASLAVWLCFNLIPGHRPYSRGVLVIDWMLTLGLLAASRVTYRLLREARGALPAGPLKRVLIVGAGRSGVSLAKDLLTARRQDVELVGFVDDDPEKQDSTLLGRPILGTTRDVEEIRRRRPIDQVIVAIPSAPPRVLRGIAERARGVPDVRIVGPLESLLRAKGGVVPSMAVPEDTFLPRHEVDLAAADLTRFFEGKRVLITGAGGSIGSELARQLAAREEGRLERLLLLDCAETPLWQVQREANAWLGERAVAVMASVRDTDRLRELLRAERPDVILHAAALKHVPMCEQHPLEALATNAVASARLAQLAQQEGVPNFTLVSTDKAVAPSCVMGATKRAAETYVQSLAQPPRGRTRFAAVRFGNVLGSNGSVLPLFHEQIAKGGPVTVTDPDATRFFMTIPEACGLILQATRIAQGGDIYVLDMGQPVRVLDIAHSLIRLYGFEPGRDIEVRIIGLRPGEKLHETLVDEAEEAEPLGQAKLLRIRGRNPGQKRCAELLAALELALEHRDEAAALRVLCQMVPTFRRARPEDPSEVEDAHTPGAPVPA